MKDILIADVQDDDQVVNDITEYEDFTLEEIGC